MPHIMLSTLIQILFFCIGSILLIYSGKQDLKTRKPLLLIPAVIALGLSSGIIPGLIITLASILIFNLPKKVNKIIGKADLLLLYSILAIIISGNNIILSIMLFATTFFTLIEIILDKNRIKEIPYIHYYSLAYKKVILICAGIKIFSTMGGLI